MPDICSLRESIAILISLLSSISLLAPPSPALSKGRHFRRLRRADNKLIRGNKE
jgi:hypothetical protein